MFFPLENPDFISA